VTIDDDGARPFTIRLARPAEYAAVGDLTVAAYRADGLLPRVDGRTADAGFADAVRAYEDSLRAAGDRAAAAELWVADDGSQLLGAVTFCPPGSSYREIAAEGEAEFRMLVTSPAARRLGVGTALVRHCLRRGRDLGLARIVLSSNTTMTAAHQLYKNLGFLRLPERDRHPFPGVDLDAFALDL
jgi:ribosomal protein S18 acetylase RimI-like enzyme